ncbi:uncharacterized protein LOC135091209 [Scylla paramamosain]|uniref:uncharacterized protein LOC135091209 n=1 Tax=Scylla paramamosain TaxID=85552 RepID=UPI003082ED6E
MQCGNEHTPPPVDYAALAAAQGDQELRALWEGPTDLQRLRCRIPDSASQLWVMCPLVHRLLSWPAAARWCATSCPARRRPLVRHLPPRPDAVRWCATSCPAPMPPAGAPSPSCPDAARSCTIFCPSRTPPARAPPVPARRRPLVHHLPSRPDAARSGTTSRLAAARWCATSPPPGGAPPRRPSLQRARLAPALAACSGPPSPPVPDRPRRLLLTALAYCFGPPSPPTPDRPRRPFRTVLAACSGPPSPPLSAQWVASPRSPVSAWASCRPVAFPGCSWWRTWTNRSSAWISSRLTTSSWTPAVSAFVVGLLHPCRALCPATSLPGRQHNLHSPASPPLPPPLLPVPSPPLQPPPS